MKITNLQLPVEAYEIFNQKGETNAQKVRRIVQITHDIAGPDFSKLRILDVGCAEGVYAIEAALRGAAVLATDARDERLCLGRAIAAKMGIDNIRFEVRDVRTLGVDNDGEFDVVYLFGLLYHLQAGDGCKTVDRLAAMCRRMMIIDTHIAFAPTINASHEHCGRRYEGKLAIEHDPGDGEEVKRARLLSSIDNEVAFHFTAPSLQRLLVEAGFSSVYECHAPLTHINAQPLSRVTYVAVKSERQPIVSYPWLNDLTEDEIEQRVAQMGPYSFPSQYAGPPVKSVINRIKRPRSLTKRLKAVLNSCLRSTGYELRRLPPEGKSSEAKSRKA